MRVTFSLLFILLFGWASRAQVTPQDSIPSDLNEAEQDSLMQVMLEDVYIGKESLDYANKKEFLILQNRVYKVYPYARIAAERLTMLDRNMSKLKTKQEKKKYYKIVEDYIENEFSEKLKKLSRKQGQILIKLIYRQTGRTTFSIIKDYKNGWKAFWSNSTAKVFDLDLKRGYDPYQVNEDYLIETILVRAFESGRLQRQQAATPIDIDDLDKYWTSKAVQQANEKATGKKLTASAVFFLVSKPPMRQRVTRAAQNSSKKLCAKACKYENLAYFCTRIQRQRSSTGWLFQGRRQASSDDVRPARRAPGGQAGKEKKFFSRNACRNRKKSYFCTRFDTEAQE